MYIIESSFLSNFTLKQCLELNAYFNPIFEAQLTVLPLSFDGRVVDRSYDVVPQERRGIRNMLDLSANYH